MTVFTPEKLQLATDAIDHALRRLRADPRLAYLAGPGSELFNVLTDAHAEIHGIDVMEFRARLQAQLTFQPVPAIGSRDLDPYIDPELYVRMEAFDGGVHNLQSRDDLAFVVNHFLRLGLAAAEAERDAHTEELF